MERRIVAFLAGMLFASNACGGVRDYCLNIGVDWRIVESIGELEGIRKGGKPYPYIIRVNTRGVRIKGIKEISPNVYDCLNEELCRAVARKLVEAGVKNFDVGYFQVNYYHYKNYGRREELLREGFSYEGEYRIVCRIVSKLLERYGYTARAVARYHSSRPDENYAYALKFWRKYKKKLKSNFGAMK